MIYKTEIRIVGKITSEMVLELLKEIDDIERWAEPREILQRYNNLKPSFSQYIPISTEFIFIIENLSQKHLNDLYVELLDCKKRKMIKLITILSEILVVGSIDPKMVIDLLKPFYDITNDILKYKGEDRKIFAEFDELLDKYGMFDNGNMYHLIRNLNKEKLKEFYKDITNFKNKYKL